MKTQLDPKQLKRMYGSKPRPKNNKTNKQNQLNIQETVDSVFVVIDNQKHQFPSWNAYNKLLRDYEHTKSNVQSLMMEIRNLQRIIQSMGQNINYIENDLQNKLDRQ